MRERFFQILIALLVALAVIYFFKQDILNLLGDAGQNILKNYLEKGVIFLAGLASKLLAAAKSVISAVAGIILKIFGNATELYKLIDGVLWLLGKFFDLIKNLFGFITGKI